MPRKKKTVRVIWKWLMFNKRGFTLTTVVYPKSITELDREGDYLLEVPRTLVQFTNLQKLNLSCNMLDESIVRLCGLTNLVELNLGMTGITRLPREFAQLQKLEVLELDFNYGMKHISRVITQLKSLKKSTFYGCNLNLQMHDETYKNPHLERLGELPNLEHLDLSRNLFLTEIPEQLKQCTKLNKIYLFKNKEALIDSARAIFTPEQITFEDKYTFKSVTATL